MATQASKALSLYKTILRTGRKWPVPEDREYIKTEAKRLFRYNRSIQDKEKIDAKLFEAEARLELAIHYKTPHPKPYNLTKQATPERIAEEPGRYLHSSHLHSHYDKGSEDL